MLKTTLTRTAGLSHWKRLGKVKLGIKKLSTKVRCAIPNHKHVDDCFYQYPVDVNYFVIPEQFKAKLGPEPQRLEIMLAFPTLEQNFDTRAAVYRSNGSKFCSTRDDVKAERIGEASVPNPKTGAMEKKTVYKTIDCPALECEFRKRGECKERGQFEFIVPGLYPEVGTLFLKIGSKVAIGQILATLQALEVFCQNRPNGLQGVRLVLEREKMTFNVDTKGDGTLTKVEKWIPKITIDYAHLRADDQALLLPVVGQDLVVPDVATDEDLNTEDGDEPKIIDAK